ncbi:GntR family transcriptional regulator [Clostridium sp. AF18-27]|uniref:DNA-binding transcriptional regulator, GntR family n=1 Tax=Enterocloster lavalensis TaxID=460384 RepID=A0A1I0G3G6_9FIRM|nr:MULTISPECIES: GntR family transcriptional regulator [Enterocloster]MBS5604718.1 GntR family transcriptional regulator [Enterocloster asparagiformis]RHR55211.1 GntR family transcriptional regulator [Clostridium sp. AF18-27]MCB6346491.1 GntR family transcriptional regulator [Enterocloster lavalensis]MDR3757508.1 GntR family transcriptional regulator [Enterocloster sp.]PST30333.1 GntR family transcriptional regulator [Enterocloster lavalensis]
MEEKNYKSRGEMVGETLKQEILDLRLKPGQMISENDVCDRFGVSRTPVREALRLLQEQGFVETVPYRGTYVTLLSLDNIKQMIYMRVAVETMVLRDFIAVQSPMVMEDIRHQIAKQQALIQEKDFEPEQFYRMDAKMHSIWFTAVRRQKLWEMLQAQQLHYTRFRMLDFITETDFTRIIGEHKELFGLIEARDERGVEASLKEHLYYSMKRMRKSIEVDYKDYFEEEPEEGRFVI